MDPKAKECLYLGAARNHLSESKRVLVRTIEVIRTRNVTWAHVPFSRPPTARSTPSVEGERAVTVEETVMVEETRATTPGVRSILFPRYYDTSHREQ